MKKSIILKSLIVVIFGVMLFSLTGCTNKVTIETNNNDELENKTNEVVDEKNESETSEEKQELTKAEIEDLESFINDTDELNTGFLFINYNNPEDLTKKIANENEEQYLGESAIRTLRYAIINSGYGKEATAVQIQQIYG